ncbi:aminotransferase-like domain-containing protein [Chitinimonas koreensis]|uniref:aminotransferase-like domain-containing protein n=1 Tax=Chitinimonas koreensis TaxID=356302 RepID=UPI0016541631|nr:PLP-dependent aminotransferase family protein [Chitinimonas koreensis]QNM95774.1 PLP-dependent aminotransferase family protein [Chitinimonas koreensis]
MRTERANTLYASLADDIAALIAAGTLRPGDRLPSLRELRDKRGVSLSTVTEAFHLLEDRGLIEARPQSGFYVRRRPVEPPPPSRPSQEPAAVTVNRRLWDYLQLTRGRQHGFCYAVLAPECFPNAQLQRLMNEALRESPNLLSEYGGTRGLEVLRRQVARHAMEWGGRLTADDVQITAGGIEALNLALRAVTQPGDVVAVESPTYFGLLQLFESMGLKALEIPTDPEHGISLAALELATRDDAVAACVLMPNFSNPTGSLMSDEAKQQLVRLLAERGVPLIEDDIYGDFHQGRERPRPAKAFDETGNVLYVASYTKVVAPGMRVGWIAPGRYRARVEILKYINTFSTRPSPRPRWRAFWRAAATTSTCGDCGGCAATNWRGSTMAWRATSRPARAGPGRTAAICAGWSYRPAPTRRASCKARYRTASASRRGRCSRRGMLIAITCGCAAGSLGRRRWRRSCGGWGAGAAGFGWGTAGGAASAPVLLLG